ncbi:MAG: hypothetical protein ACRDG4_20785, partial [Chloroflexota bacterium]
MIAVATAPSTGADSSPAPVAAGGQTTIAGVAGAGDQPSFGSVLARAAVGDTDAPAPTSNSADKSHKTDGLKKDKDEDTAAVPPLALSVQTLSAAASSQLPPPLPLPPILDGGAAGSGPKTKDGPRADGIQTFGAASPPPAALGDLPAGLSRATPALADHLGEPSAKAIVPEGHIATLAAKSDKPSSGPVYKHALPSGIDPVSGGPRRESSAAHTDLAPPNALADLVALPPTNAADHAEHGKAALPLIMTALKATAPNSNRTENTVGSNRWDDAGESLFVRPDPGKRGDIANPVWSAPAASLLTGDPSKAAPLFMSSQRSDPPAGTARPGGVSPMNRQASPIRIAGTGDGTSAHSTR